MSFGIMAINDDGEKLIDDTYGQLVSLGKHSVSSIVPAGFGGWGVNKLWYVDVVSPKRPVVFLKIPGGEGWQFTDRGIALFGVEDQGANVWRILVVATGSYTPDANCVYPYYEVDGASGEGWGLQVFDAAGAEVFDSGFDTINITKPGANIAGTHRMPQAITSTFTANDNYRSQSVTYSQTTDPNDVRFGAFWTGQHVRYDSTLPPSQSGSYADIIQMPVYSYTGTTVQCHRAIVLFQRSAARLALYADNFYYYGDLYGSRSIIYRNQAMIKG